MIIILSLFLACGSSGGKDFTTPLLGECSLENERFVVELHCANPPDHLAFCWEPADKSEPCRTTPTRRQSIDPRPWRLIDAQEATVEFQLLQAGDDWVVSVY